MSKRSSRDDYWLGEMGVPTGSSSNHVGFLNHLERERASRRRKANSGGDGSGAGSGFLAVLLYLVCGRHDGAARAGRD